MTLYGVARPPNFAQHGLFSVHPFRFSWRSLTGVACHVKGARNACLDCKMRKFWYHLGCSGWNINVFANYWHVDKNLNSELPPTKTQPSLWWTEGNTRLQDQSPNHSAMVSSLLCSCTSFCRLQGKKREKKMHCAHICTYLLTFDHLAGQWWFCNNKKRHVFTLANENP